MDVIQTGRKDRHLNTLEKYIYKISRNNFHMNDTYIDTYNPIFQTLHELYNSSTHTHTHTHTRERYISRNMCTEHPHKGHTPNK
jgi:hypothetical protein